MPDCSGSRTDRRTDLAVLLAVVAVLAAFAVHAWAGAQPATGGVHVTVTSADFAAWPFAVPAGELGCDHLGDDEAVTFETGGVRYAVNATAEQRRDGVDVRPVLDAGPGTPGLRAGLDEVVGSGLALCR